MSNVLDYISPIRLRSIPGDLAGETVRVSGWGITSDSKYNFLIISHFKFKNCTYQNGCFKGKENHGLKKIFLITGNTFYLYYDMQSVGTFQGYMAVLYEPANCCCVYIKNIIL